jgi:hypothetical protein
MPEYKFKRAALVEYTAVIVADTEEEAAKKLTQKPVEEVALWQNKRWFMGRFKQWAGELMVVAVNHE